MEKETFIGGTKELMKTHLSISNQRESIKAYADCYKGKLSTHKEIIVKYFASIKPHLFTTVRVKDMVTGTDVKEFCNSRYFDGNFSWDEADVYHFVKYNMPLSENFIEYVISKQL